MRIFQEIQHRMGMTFAPKMVVEVGNAGIYVNAPVQPARMIGFSQVKRHEWIKNIKAERNRLEREGLSSVQIYSLDNRSGIELELENGEIILIGSEKSLEFIEAVAIAWAKWLGKAITRPNL